MTRNFITLLVAREAGPLYVTLLQQYGRRLRLDEKDRLGPTQLSPPVQRHPIEHMMSQMGVVRQRRMLEVVRRITDHAETFHDADRADVGRDRERDDLIQPGVTETETERCQCRFGCVFVQIQRLLSLH